MNCVCVCVIEYVCIFGIEKNQDKEKGIDVYIFKNGKRANALSIVQRLTGLTD